MTEVMEDFLRRANEARESDVGQVRLTSAMETEKGAVLSLQISDDRGAITAWQLEAQDVREHRFELGPCDFTMQDSHPLLWPHQEAHCSLFFSSKPTNAWTTCGKLWARHQRETNGSLIFERFLNPLIGLPALLESGDGLLATGPERLLLAYTEELDSEAVLWSIAGRRPAGTWRPNPRDSSSGEWLSGGPLKVLVAERTYVVAARFETSQIAPPRAN